MEPWLRLVPHSTCDPVFPIFLMYFSPSHTHSAIISSFLYVLYYSLSHTVQLDTSVSCSLLSIVLSQLLEDCETDGTNHVIRHFPLPPLLL